MHFTGASNGLEDMGRDLIAENEDSVLIIQCKRWIKEKTIHEKHIFQLYGSTVLWSMQHPKSNTTGVFVTTTKLSDTARKCAEYLKITIVENLDFPSYPMIKCNVGKDGEKIYHLPFDQHYDRIFIRQSDGDRYVSTVSDAEQLGFRHAYKWSQSNINQ